MEVISAIQKRYSVRKYENKPVEREVIMRLIEAARIAPSASNRQEWRFVVVTDAETRDALRDAASGQRFVAQAPIVIAACAETDGHTMKCGEACYPIDVAIALDHISLQATAEGLGTCWIGAFEANKVREILGIPSHIKVVELMTVGYPADAAPEDRRRKSTDEILSFDKWGFGA